MIIFGLRRVIQGGSFDGITRDLRSTRCNLDVPECRRECLYSFRIIVQRKAS